MSWGPRETHILFRWNPHTFRWDTHVHYFRWDPHTDQVGTMWDSRTFLLCMKITFILSIQQKYLCVFTCLLVCVRNPRTPFFFWMEVVHQFVFGLIFHRTFFLNQTRGRAYAHQTPRKNYDQIDRNCPFQQWTSIGIVNLCN